MITSIGILNYTIDKLVVDVDPGLVGLYRALVPPYERPKPQKWPGHITVVRNEIPPNAGRWGAHDSEFIEFEFDPVVVSDATYLWLNVTCPRLVSIRNELGLPAMSALTKPPDGTDFFHITLGNFKGA